MSDVPSYMYFWFLFLFFTCCLCRSLRSILSNCSSSSIPCNVSSHPSTCSQHQSYRQSVYDGCQQKDMWSCKSYRAVCCTLQLHKIHNFLEALPCLSRWRRVRRYIVQQGKLFFSEKSNHSVLKNSQTPCFQPINFFFSPEIPTFFPPLLFHQTPKPPSANTFVTPFFTPPPPPPPRFSPSTPSLPAMPDTDSFSDSRKR